MKTMLVLLALIGCGSFTALASEKSDLLENWYLENQRCRGGMEMIQLRTRRVSVAL
jgi:hypothetical protein